MKSNEKNDAAGIDAAGFGVAETAASRDNSAFGAFMSRRGFVALASLSALGAAGVLDGCSSETGSGSSGGSAAGTLAFDDAAWNYDSDNDVYWQVGVVYCESPAAEDYESLGVYVPGAYLDGKENSDGTFTCTVSETGEVAGYTALTAPMVMPVNTAGYSAQAAPTSYSYQSVADYLEAGFVYVYAGCRGRDNGYADDGSLEFSGGAPWGVTDLKAAVRYLRYNAAFIPGNKEAVFTFGHSGGGAQSALMGATGDSSLYDPYLESIGAAMEDADGAAVSDAVAGSMCWCPITCLDQGDAAYEWMMGQYASTGTRAEGTWTALMSEDLAASYADYINDLGLSDDSGTVLALAESSEGVCASGTYYDYVKGIVQESLNNFLSDTEFPYTAGSSTMADGGFGGGLGGESGDGGMGGDGEAPDGAGGGLPDGEAPDDEDGGEAPGDMSGGNLPDGELPDGEIDGEMSVEARGGDLPEGDAPDGADDAEGGELPSGGTGGPDASGDTAEQTTYETVQDYIDALNADEEWVSYDSSTNMATITDLGAFVRCCKAPSKDVGAFDATDRSQAENTLFGNDENDALHFDSTMASLLEENAEAYAACSDWDDSLPEAYADDREQLDALGGSIDERAAMYNPLYYLVEAYEGAGTSTVAPHWRVRSGIEQGDTSLTTEINLALALGMCEQVEDVDFATVWAQGHTTAERTGDSTDNFIAWVNECME